MKSEFPTFDDGEKHTAIVLIDGYQVFSIENAEMEVNISLTEEVDQIAPGVFKKEILADSIEAKVEIKGRFNPATAITFGGN